MNGKTTPTVHPFGTGFTAIERGYYARIRAQGGDSLDEREALKEESKQLNTTQFYSVVRSGSKLAVRHGMNTPSKVGTVAVIPVKGVMQKYSSGYWFRVVGTQEIRQNIKAARANPIVTAIVMDFDTGGGQVDGNHLFSDEIFEAREDKPVYGYVDGMACSAGYQAAAQCEKIFMASPTDYVGSIGVFQMHIDESQWLESWGLKVEYIVADGGENKVVAPSTQPLSEEDRQKVKAQLNELRTTMISQIERGRGNRIKPVEGSTYSGSIFTYKKAKQMGLVDGQAKLEDVILKAFRAGDKKKRGSSSANTQISIKKNSMWNLKSVLAGLLGDDSTPTFTEDQVLSAQEATQFAQKTAKLVEEKDTLSTQADQDKETISGLEEKLKAEETKTQGIQSKFDELSKQFTDLKAQVNGTSAETEESKKEADTPKPEVETKPAAETKPVSQTAKATIKLEDQTKEEEKGAEAAAQKGEEGEEDPLKQLALQMSTLATQVENLTKAKNDETAQREAIEAKYKKVVESYNELTEGQGKAGFVEDTDKPKEEKKVGWQNGVLPPISKYTRQISSWS